LLDLYIHLDISDKKVVHLIAEINVELASLQRQWIKLLSKIPVEEGESELMKMMDDSRASQIIIKQ
jgi:hypothetical protein